MREKENGVQGAMKLGGIQVWVRRARRRSWKLSMNSHGELEVWTPGAVADQTVKNFLLEHRTWIAKQRKLYETRYLAYRDVYEYRAVLFCGRAYPIRRGRAGFDGTTFTAFRVRELADAVLRAGEGSVRCRMEELCARYGFAPHSLTFRRMKSKWGRCDSLGRICLSSYLVMLPERLQEYVLVHELCHLRVMNHSAVFWQTVARILPDYRERRTELRFFEFLTQLYGTEITAAI